MVIMSNVTLFIRFNYRGSAQSLTWHGDREDRGEMKCHPLCEHRGGTAGCLSWLWRQSPARHQHWPWRPVHPLVLEAHGSHAGTGDGQRCASATLHEALDWMSCTVSNPVSRWGATRTINLFLQEKVLPGPTHTPVITLSLSQVPTAETS